MLDAIGLRPPSLDGVLRQAQGTFQSVSTAAPSPRGAAAGAAQAGEGAADTPSPVDPLNCEAVEMERIRFLYRTRSRDLVAAQVKTLSFLAYLLRGYADRMRPHEDRIISNVVQLLQLCPRESVATRKEALVAMRHVLASPDFRRGFHRHIDALLDERVLIGTTRHTEPAPLRPLAYSALADLVHHIRTRLTMAQMGRVVHVFARVVHDCSLSDLPMTVRVTSVRLLLNLVDHIFHNREKDAQLGRDLLVRVLVCLVRKFGTLRKAIEANVIASSKREGKVDNGIHGGEGNADAVTQAEKQESKFEQTPPAELAEEKGTEEKKRDGELMSKPETPPKRSTRRGMSPPRKSLRLKETATDDAVMSEGEATKEKEDGMEIEDVSRATGSDIVKKEEDVKNVDITDPNDSERKYNDANSENVMLESASRDATLSFEKKNSRRSTRCLPPDSSFEGVLSPENFTKEVRALLRPMVLGLKTVIWCVNNYGHQREKARREERQKAAAAKAAGPTKASQGQGAGSALCGDGTGGMGTEDSPAAVQRITHDERELIDEFIVEALPCLKVFKEELAGTSGKEGPSCEYSEVLGTYASCLSVLDAYNLRRTVGPRVPFLVDSIVEDEEVLVVPKHLLMSASSSVSFDFCDVLLDYLVEHMADLSPLLPQKLTNTATDSNDITLSQPSSAACPIILHNVAGVSKAQKWCGGKRAAGLLDLFELTLKSTGLHPKNESALRPRLQTLVATCLRSSTERGPPLQSVWPGCFFSLLRSVFRTISGGKFEESYKELLPLLPTVLNGLYRIYGSTKDVTLQKAIIDLCLTIPARLSSLLPHLSLLLRIIVPALRSDCGDLVNLG